MERSLVRHLQRRLTPANWDYTDDTLSKPAAPQRGLFSKSSVNGLQTEAVESQRVLWTFSTTNRSGGFAGLSQLGQIQDAPGSWKLSVAQSFISARVVIDGEQNPPSNPPSEDEDKLSMDMVVPIMFFLQREKGCPKTVVQCIKRLSRGEIKPLWHCGKVTAWAGSYDNRPARQTKYFPQHE